MIQAIETSYGGCRFRSRLEARWAVFFDEMGIQWQYEPEGFKLSYSGRYHYYLPDFLLPQCGTWIEVKGDESSLDRHNLLPLAAAQLPTPSPATGYRQGPVIMLLGPIPPYPDAGSDWGWVSAMRDCRGENIPPVGDRYSTMCCGFSSFNLTMKAGDCYGPFRQEFCGNPHCLEPCVIPGVARVECRAAYTAARSARFENGERTR